MAEDLEMGLTTAQVAKHLHAHPVTIRRWAKTGKLPYLTFGRRMLFSRKVIDSILAKGGDLSDLSITNNRRT
jgi:excisionase family DNA binding protein